MVFLRAINKIKLISACAKISQNKHRLLTAAICVLRCFKVGRYSYKMSTWRWSTSSKTDIYQSCGFLDYNQYGRIGKSHVIQSGVANNKLSSVSVVQLCKGKLSNTCTCGT